MKGRWDKEKRERDKWTGELEIFMRDKVRMKYEGAV